MAEVRARGLLPRGRGLHRRMAGAGGRPPAACGPARGAFLRGRSAPCGVDRALRAGRGVALVFAALACFHLASAEAQVVASRIWPARDYTRLTLESQAELKFQVFAVKDPDRLGVDLEHDTPPR